MDILLLYHIRRHHGMYEDEILDIEDSQFSRRIIEDTNDVLMIL